MLLLHLPPRMQIAMATTYFNESSLYRCHRTLSTFAIRWDSTGTLGWIKKEKQITEYILSPSPIHVIPSTNYSRLAGIPLECEDRRYKFMPNRSLLLHGFDRLRSGHIPNIETCDDMRALSNTVSTALSSSAPPTTARSSQYGESFSLTARTSSAPALQSGAGFLRELNRDFIARL